MLEPAELDAYFARIGYSGGLSRDRATLGGLQYAHATTIPFENLDIHLGRPIRVDAGSVFAKLVHSKRGGYCFEHNTLFAEVLASLGFPVTRLAARVRRAVEPGVVRPRTHLLLEVVADGERWISDVGYGGPGPLRPIPLVGGTVVSDGGWAHRLVREEPRTWVLQVHQGGSWADLYVFSEEPQHPVDIEMANYFTSTHPLSRFVHTITAQLPGPEMRLVLRGRQLFEHRPDTVTSCEVDGDEEVLEVLAERFGLSFPAGTRFRPPLTLGTVPEGGQGLGSDQ